jgi:hypothetical protein
MAMALTERVCIVVIEMGMEVEMEIRKQPPSSHHSAYVLHYQSTIEYGTPESIMALLQSFGNSKHSNLLLVSGLSLWPN